MYAVVTSGGKQYRVEPGATLVVERLVADAGETITFDRVLLLGDGDDVTVGTPNVAGASVSGTVVGDALGPKVVIFKFKQKVKYRRRTGHRQHLTRVRIDAISGNGKTARAEDRAQPTPAKKRAAPKAAERRAATLGAAKATTPKATVRRTRAASGAAKSAAQPKPAAAKPRAAKPSARGRSTKKKSDT